MAGTTKQIIHPCGLGFLRKKEYFMSLLVCACFENYAVVAADSRAVKVEQGRVVPIGDRYCKFWTLDEGRIAVGLTGSFLMGQMLSRFTHEIAEQCRGLRSCVRDIGTVSLSPRPS